MRPRWMTADTGALWPKMVHGHFASRSTVAAVAPMLPLSSVARARIEVAPVPEAKPE